MNFSQRFGLFILILISAAYVYFSFFNKEISLPKFKAEEQENTIYNPLEHSLNKEENKKVEAKNVGQKTVKIFVVDNSGKRLIEAFELLIASTISFALSKGIPTLTLGDIQQLFTNPFLII